MVPVADEYKSTNGRMLVDMHAVITNQLMKLCYIQTFIQLNMHVQQFSCQFLPAKVIYIIIYISCTEIRESIDGLIYVCNHAH